MGRPRTPHDQKPVDIHTYASPDLVAWVDGLADSQGLDRSKAMRWVLVVVRYAMRELGDAYVTQVFDVGAELSGTRLGILAKAELDRQRPVPMAHSSRHRGQK